MPKGERMKPKPKAWIRLPWPSKTRMFNPRVPEGTTGLIEAIGLVLRRWNGERVADAVVVAEAFLLLSDRLQDHPDVTEPERIAVAEKAGPIRKALEWAYSHLDGPPKRP